MGGGGGGQLLLLWRNFMATFAICSNFRFGGQLINVLELMGTIKRTFQTVKVMFMTHEKILKDDF